MATPGPSTSRTPKKKMGKQQTALSKFAMAKHTRRNVSKYINTPMSTRDKPKIDPNLILENTVNSLPVDMVTWHYERIRALGVEGMRDFVLVEAFNLTRHQPMFKHVASGAFGDVYATTVSSEFRKALVNTYKNPKTFNKLMPHIPKVGTGVVIKVDKRFTDSSYNAWNKINKGSFYANMNTHVKETASYLRRVKREMTVGQLLYNYKGPRGYRGKQFFPKLYAMFTDPECGLAITIMEHVEGISMEEYIKAKKARKETIPFKVLDQMSRGIMTMWMAGFVHSDLHHKNVIVTKNEDVKIIDFGMARLIPEKTHAKIVQMFNQGKHIEDIWQESGIGGWSNRNMGTKGYPWYNPNIYSARVLKSTGTVKTK